ncbi:glycerophosphodiester phosphodiesterase, partial [Lactiplantibacillus plantarum]
MLSRGWHLVMQGARQLAGPLACWWLAGILLAVLAKVLGILVGGVVSLLGLLLLSAWLPAMVARSNHESWQAGQFLYRWVLLMFTAVWWLPLGWLGYLATLQASI